VEIIRKGDWLRRSNFAQTKIQRSCDNGRHAGSQYAVPVPSRRVSTWISALSSSTTPAFALAMRLRTRSVVSSIRVLGRWNLRVAVDTRRQRLYRLGRERSAANTSSDLIALIAPVEDFEDSPSTLVTTRTQSQIFLRRRDGRTFRYGRWWVGRAIRRKLEAYWGCSRLLVQSQRRDVCCTYVAIRKLQLKPK
jgi:hypothetical protein